MRDRSIRSDPSVDWFQWYFPPCKSISLARVDVQFILRVQVKESRCGEVFRGAICPRCKKVFFICRHCDRGHVYCCKLCSLLSRIEKCLGYQRRYRESEGMREYLREQERERRSGGGSAEKDRGDHTYEDRARSARVSAPVRMAAALAVIGSVGGEETQDDEICCEFCGCRAKFVYFGDGSTRQRKRGRVFRFRS